MEGRGHTMEALKGAMEGRGHTMEAQNGMFYPDPGPDPDPKVNKAL